ncbi:transcriptional regulator, AraC family domain protein [Burkholderia cepacia]|nr:transcriptional regulator, AraC family domain protein [Burkholderia cepacia]
MTRLREVRFRRTCMSMGPPVDPITRVEKSCIRHLPNTPPANRSTPPPRCIQSRPSPIDPPEPGERPAADTRRARREVDGWSRPPHHGHSEPEPPSKGDTDAADGLHGRAKLRARRPRHEADHSERRCVSMRCQPFSDHVARLARFNTGHRGQPRNAVSRDRAQA